MQVRVALVVFIGAAIMLASTIAVGVGELIYLKRREATVLHGWTLAPMLVASVAIEQGTVITSDLVAERAVPEQFDTASLVPPDRLEAIIGKRTLARMEAGDLVRWSGISFGGSFSCESKVFLGMELMDAKEACASERQPRPSLRGINAR